MDLQKLQVLPHEDVMLIRVCWRWRVEGSEDKMELSETRTKVESLLSIPYPLLFHTDFELWTLQIIHHSGETS